MDATIGPKGQIVIPKPLRDKYHLRPGDRVSVEDHEDHIGVDPRPMEARLATFFAGLPRRAGTSKLDAAALRNLADEQYEAEWG